MPRDHPGRLGFSTSSRKEVASRIRFLCVGIDSARQCVPSGECGLFQSRKLSLHGQPPTRIRSVPGGVVRALVSRDPCTPLDSLRHVALSGRMRERPAQTKVETAWLNLVKGPMTALQFEPKFETCITEMELAGTPLTQQQLFTGVPLTQHVFMSGE